MVDRLYRNFLLMTGTHAEACKAFIDQNWRELAKQKRYLSVEVTEHGQKRSSEQNRRFFALLRAISEQAWVNGRTYDIDTWKAYYARKFLGSEDFLLPDGTKIDVPMSTAKLSMSDFNDFMARIEADAAEHFGIVL